ncbi:MAG: cytochrome b/b6 domain-containing protein [Polaromonas sp.]|nr:cytochrome b/b6 domain-containing protein [Polaromonas sp.]
MYEHERLNKVRIWDLPTRIFHWALVLCVTGLAITGTVGGSAMAWHFRFGYAVLALLLFRIIWGLLGGRWSRFAAFLYAPKSLLLHIKGQGRPEHDVGHTPLGALSVFALLGILIAQVGTGLLSDDEISFAGPLTGFVSNASVSLATTYHTEIGKWLLLGLVLLHIAAIFFYLYRKHNLVAPMLHGDKSLAVDVLPSRDDALSRLAALLVLLACAAVAFWVSTLGAPAF